MPSCVITGSSTGVVMTINGATSMMQPSTSRKILMRIRSTILLSETDSSASVISAGIFK